MNSFTGYTVAKGVDKKVAAGFDPSKLIGALAGMGA